MRGNPLTAGITLSKTGSIPACAGEPRVAVENPIPFRVYPRVCGGTLYGSVNLSTLIGLSPRVRGNLDFVGDSRDVNGSIPACAGEPLVVLPLALAVRVYPRVCGGTPDHINVATTRGGLSPRVRGNRMVSISTSYRKGSIPACAGEPRTPSAAGNAAGVYPRVCGGTVKEHRIKTPVSGLSPRVRGNRLPKSPARTPAGSIPACAGEPLGAMVGTGIMGVYPRVCGGTVLGLARLWAGQGLSPRVRGNPLQRQSTHRRQRSIPACAGEPPRRSPRACPPSVYPRVCGGTRLPRRPVSPIHGLSPRVRGNR